jgi:hypothetical protein
MYDASRGLNAGNGAPAVRHLNEGLEIADIWGGFALIVGFVHRLSGRFS